MKKTLIAVAAAAALFVGSAFAVEFGTGAWLNAIWTPVASDGDDLYSDASNSWGGYRAARLNIFASTDDGKAGVLLDVYADNKELGLGDNDLIWLKPIDQIRVSVGKIDSPYYGMRGDFCLPSWNWMRAFNWKADDEGLTFSGMGGYGVLLDIYPIKGLQISGFAPASGDGSYNAWYDKFDCGCEDKTSPAYYMTAEYVYRDAAIAASYQILDVAKIKVGWFGNWWGSDKETNWIDNKNKSAETYGNLDVGVDLSIIDPLWITVGFEYKFAKEDAFGWWNDDPNGDGDGSDGKCVADGAWDMKIALGVSYNVLDALLIQLQGAYFAYLNQSVNDDTPMALQLGLGVTYNFGGAVEGLSAMADVRWLTDLDDSDNDVWTFLVGVTYNINSNSLIGVGFQGVTNGWGFENTLQYKDDFAWAIPLRFSVYF